MTAHNDKPRPAYEPPNLEALRLTTEDVVRTSDPADNEVDASELWG